MVALDTIFAHKRYLAFHHGGYYEANYHSHFDAFLPVTMQRTDTNATAEEPEASIEKKKGSLFIQGISIGRGSIRCSCVGQLASKTAANGSQERVVGGI
ncbi:MAG: hypothetical protein ACYSWW_17210 [Planctomycetota bacterium]|jgi:hypothetical protein